MRTMTTLEMLVCFALINGCLGQLEMSRELAEKEKRLPSEQCGKVIQVRMRSIIGGVPAELGKFPWMARVIGKKSTRHFMFCGGSLITERHVITAAHCVKRSNFTCDTIKVTLGELDTDPSVNDNASPRNYDVDQVIVHNGWDSFRKINDISILKLKGRVEFTDLIRPICLPTSELRSRSFMGDSLAVAGWGRTDPNRTGSRSSQLMTVTVKVVARDTCLQKYRSLEDQEAQQVVIDDRVLCAGSWGMGSCKGDSGGPLMYSFTPSSDPSGDARQYLIGLVSYGEGCGLERFLKVNTNVSHHMPWILSNLDI